MPLETLLKTVPEMPLEVPLSIPRETLLNMQPEVPLEILKTQMGSNFTLPPPPPPLSPLPFPSLPHSSSPSGAGSPSAAGSRQDRAGPTDWASLAEHTHTHLASQSMPRRPFSQGILHTYTYNIDATSASSTYKRDVTSTHTLFRTYT